MKTLTSSATIVSSPFYLPIFSPKSKDPSSIGRRILRFSISPKNNDNQSELRSNSNDSCLVPILSNRTLSKDAVMGLVLSAANVRGWTTDSGMEGPPVPAGSESESSTEKISTFPCSLFTKSPRRRMRVAFTCNVCGQGTTSAINPHVYTEGTVFVQFPPVQSQNPARRKSPPSPGPSSPSRHSVVCVLPSLATFVVSELRVQSIPMPTLKCCVCNVFHKLVDNLNLFREMKCYVNPSFNYRDPKGDVSFTYLDMDDDNNDIFPLI